MTTKFEVGRIYVYERKDLFGKETLKDYYRCEKRTEKSVWFSHVNEDGSLVCPISHLTGETMQPTRYKIRQWGMEDEYVAGDGFGNARSVWYCGGVHLYSNKVKKSEQLIWVTWDECDGCDCWEEAQCFENWEDAAEYMKKKGKERYVIEVDE